MLDSLDAAMHKHSAMRHVLQDKQAEQGAAVAAQEQAAEQEEEEDLPLFEVQRRANIKRNRQRMANMGLSSKSLEMSPPGQSCMRPFPWLCCSRHLYFSMAMMCVSHHLLANQVISQCQR